MDRRDRLLRRRGARFLHPSNAAILGAVGDSGSDPTIPMTPWTTGSDVGVPTGTSLTTRTSLGTETSTGTFTLTDPTGRQSPVTVDVDIYEALEFTTNPVLPHRTTGNVRLFRNCRFNIESEARMVELDEVGYQVTSYMAPRTIFDHCTFVSTSSSSRALQGGNAWMEYCDVSGCEDGWGGIFCGMVIHSNIVGDTDGLPDPHADGVQLAGIGVCVFWNSYLSAGNVPGAASQGLRIGNEFSANDDVYIRWCLIDADAGGYSLQARGDNVPANGNNTNIAVLDTVVLDTGVGPVDFVNSTTSEWARVYSDTYGGTPIADPSSP